MSDKKWYEGIEERVVQAYQATGIKPQQGAWCACGLGAIAAQMGVNIEEKGNEYVEGVGYLSHERIAANLVSGTVTEVSAFIDGFDGAQSSLSPEAYDAGKRSWEAVKAAGLVTE